MWGIAILTVAIQAICVAAEGKIWALLVAGSNGYFNYRHQADVCHAYQILHKNGIPDERIVVMMYDDIAHNSANPNKGVIINHLNGPNVYEGVPKDYTGEDVTPKNFIDILLGRNMTGIGSGKTIRSTSEDTIFVYFSDHGAPQLIAFPRGELHADTLKRALEQMHEGKKYKQMLLYIEACESGSMLENTERSKFGDDWNIFATTAANDHESSYACYYDRTLGTYLGDMYSVRWMEDSDLAKPMKETVLEQYIHVRNQTTGSHVMQFGDLDLVREPIGTFQGAARTPRGHAERREPTLITDAVPSPEVPEMILKMRLKEATANGANDDIVSLQMQLDQLHKTNDLINTTMAEIAKRVVESVMNGDVQNHVEKILGDRPLILNGRCYKESVAEFRQSCFDFNEHEHALRHVYALGNMCDSPGVQTEIVRMAIRDICGQLV